MKYNKITISNSFSQVRPLAGAGIEIVEKESLWNKREFAPSRGRELK